MKTVKILLTILSVLLLGYGLLLGVCGIIAESLWGPVMCALAVIAEFLFVMLLFKPSTQKKIRIAQAVLLVACLGLFFLVFPYFEHDFMVWFNRMMLPECPTVPGFY